MSYDFSTLNDRDLEDLVRDILSKKLDVNFQSFKMGSDKGIDLRYATTNNENEIIVQVKHYLGSGLSNLKSKLKNEELEKVIKLNPQRYILVTSLSLSPQNKEELKLILSPFILSTNDIFGQNELNDSLRDYPEIEEAHFKLWISSTTVLKRIIENGVKGRSEFVKSKIIERIKIFVPSITHQESVDILNSRKFILITGAPGVGKTTLADILTYQLLAENFILVYVSEIKEAEEAFDSNTKQVFYFDDFLGSITLNLVGSKNEDSAIIHFIDRVKSEKNKRLILTCRTTILNQAKEISDVINNSTIEISKHEVKINDYGKIEKAKILYNHIYFSNLTDELKSVFFGTNFHWKVIKHTNYTPRIIQFFTDIERLGKTVDYKDEVIMFLDNPEKIWEKAYSIQLSEHSQLFLATLYSLGGNLVVNELYLKEAFEARIDYEIKNNNYKRKSNLYNKALKELLNAFISRTLIVHEYFNETKFKFLNPSIEDFLYYHFSSNNCDEYFNVLLSAHYFEQFKGRISTKIEHHSKKIYLGGKNYEKFLKIFIDKIPNLKSYSSNHHLDTISCLIRLFQWQDIKDIVIRIMNKLEMEMWSWSDRDYLIEFLDYIAENKITEEFTISYKDILLSLSEDIPSYFLIEKLSKLVSKHKIYQNLISENKENESEYYTCFQNNISKCWEEDINYFISNTYEINKVTEKEILEKVILERIYEAKKLNDMLYVDNVSALDNFTFDYKKQIDDNVVKSIEIESKIENIQKKESKENDVVIINNLFNGKTNEWEDLLF